MIRAGEDEHTELKQLVEKVGTLESVSRTVTAFANSDGGVIYIG